HCHLPSFPTRRSSDLAASGLKVRWWDFVFYMLFGLVVTSFVHIGGVLLVFSYLVVPAVCATYLVNSIPARFAIGWGIATLSSVVDRKSTRLNSSHDQI